MKYLARFLFCCLIAVPASAQRSGGMHGGGGFRGGGGFHGTVGGGFRGGISGFRGGFGGFHDFGGFRHDGFHHAFHGRNRFFRLGFNYWPWYYGYPYFGLGYGGYPSYGLGYSAYPDYDYSYSYPSYGYGYQAPVVIYQTSTEPAYAPPAAAPARAEAREPEQAQPQSKAYERPIYLIAFKHQENICAAEAYWVENGTLHYITLEHERKQATLNSIDGAFSSRLNRERRVDFRLPPEF